MAAHVRNFRINRRRRIQRVPRVFRDRLNPLEDLSDSEVFIRYRFRPNTIVFIMGLLPNLARETMRNFPLPPILQLLACLRFLATGSMHLLIGDSLNISRSSTGKSIRFIASQLCLMAGRFIKLPTGQRIVADTKRAFASIAGFPNVLGCIDGTMIRIQRPRENEADYVCRKGFHALNVQMCCNANFTITSCTARWPGSVHDSRIFRASGLCRQFENGLHNGFLIGDTAYPCRKFLLTPFIEPTCRQEEKYNTAICRTRVIIEQAFGILKRRFQSLHHEIRTEPAQALEYIIACTVLHNIGIERGDIIEIDDLVFNPNVVVDIIQPPPMNDGVAMRQHIVQTFFN